MIMTASVWCRVSMTTEINISWVIDKLVNMFLMDFSILSVCIKFMLSTLTYCETYYFNYIPPWTWKWVCVRRLCGLKSLWIKIAVSWIMTMCSVVGGYICFGEYDTSIFRVKVSGKARLCRHGERRQVFTREPNVSPLYTFVSFAKERKRGWGFTILCVCVFPISDFEAADRS